MAGEESCELSDSFVVGGLETTKECGVDVSGIGGLPISLCDDSAIYTGGVAVPDFDYGVGYGVAGRHVDYLGVEDEVNSLIFDNFFSDIFTRNI